MRWTPGLVAVAFLVVAPALRGQSADTFTEMAFRSIGPSLTTGRVADVEIDPNNATSGTWPQAPAVSGRP